VPRFPRHETIFGIDSVTQSEVKNLAASVRARLANLARSQKEDFQAFLNKSRLDADAKTLTEIAAALREFLSPIFEAVAQGKVLDQVWRPAGPWS
jgi:hypothetical protein